MTKYTAKKKSQSKKPHDADLLWRVAWTYIRTVIDTAHEPFLILDDKQRVISANRTFYRFFHVTKSDTEGVRIYKIGNGQWNIPALRKLINEILPKNTFFTDYEVTHEFPKIGTKTLLLNARRIYSAANKDPIVLLAMEDISRRKEIEEKLKAYTVRLNAEVLTRTKELELRVRQLERLNKAM